MLGKINGTGNGEKTNTKICKTIFCFYFCATLYCLSNTQLQMVVYPNCRIYLKQIRTNIPVPYLDYHLEIRNEAWGVSI